jgi:hypothetical protein
MTHQHNHQPNRPHNQSAVNFPFARIVMYVTIGVIVFYLVTEHWAHLAGFLPYSFLLLCLIMHLFMHGGHGGHGGGNSDR